MSKVEWGIRYGDEDGEPRRAASREYAESRISTKFGDKLVSRVVYPQTFGPWTEVAAVTAREQAGKSLVEQEWEANPRAMYEAHRENWKAEVKALTTQLQAAQATIAAVNARLDVMTHPYSDERIPMVKERDSIRGLYGDEVVDDLEAILSRADTSGLVALKAETLREFAQKMRGIAEGEKPIGTQNRIVYLEIEEQAMKEAASIEQAGANRG